MKRAEGETAEKELDAFITRRDRERRQTEGERDREALWEASVRADRAKQKEALRARRREHWHKMRAVHYGLADEYDQ